MSMSVRDGGFADCRELSFRRFGPSVGSGYLKTASSYKHGEMITGRTVAPRSAAFFRRTGSSLVAMYSEARKAGLTNRTIAFETSS
jgi:hypothetical protein